MKIYDYVRLDIDTGEVLEEDSFEYSGPVSKCLEADRDASGGLSGTHGGQTDWGGGSEGIDAYNENRTKTFWDNITANIKYGPTVAFGIAVGKQIYKDFKEGVPSQYGYGENVGVPSPREGDSEEDFIKRFVDESGGDSSVIDGADATVATAQPGGTPENWWNAYNPGVDPSQSPFAQPAMQPTVQPGAEGVGTAPGAAEPFDPTQEYLKDPAVADAFGRAQAANPNWTASEWAKANAAERGVDMPIAPNALANDNIQINPGDIDPRTGQPFQPNAISPDQNVLGPGQTPPWGTGVHQASSDVYNTGIEDTDAMVKKGMADITNAEDQAEQALRQALSTGRGDINQALQQVTEQMKPYGDAGKAALKSVMGMLESGVPSMEEFRKSRTYQFPLEEMTRQIQRTAAVKGKFLDPSTMNEISRYAQDYASQRLSQFREEEYNVPLQQRMDVVTGVGLPAAGEIAGTSRWAGGAKAGLEESTGKSRAANRQWGSGARVGLGTWGTGTKTNLGQNYMQNVLQKGGQGIDWFRAGEPGKERQWTEDVGIPFAREQSDKAIQFARSQGKRNQQTSIWNTLFKGGAYALGSL